MEKTPHLDQRVESARQLLGKYSGLERVVDPRPTGVAEWGVYESLASKVLLVAPHSVRHWRDGKVKGGEPGTGALVRALAEAFSQDCIFLKSDGAEVGWQQRDDLLVSTLSTAVVGGRAVIDFHGMSDKHGVNICIGTGSTSGQLGKSFLAAALAAGINAVSIGMNVPFSATATHTVTSYLQLFGHDSAMQLELAPYYREPFKKEAGVIEVFAHLLDTL